MGACPAYGVAVRAQDFTPWNKLEPSTTSRIRFPRLVLCFILYDPKI